jgi:hypothetical protein
MVLPAGVSKASGLEAALALLELSPHNVVELETPRTIMLSFGFAAAPWRSQTPYRC